LIGTIYFDKNNDDMCHKSDPKTTKEMEELINMDR